MSYSLRKVGDRTAILQLGTGGKTIEKSIYESERCLEEYGSQD